MDPVVPAKIAFEFLALHYGGSIYENRPQFESIRYQLLAGKLSEGDVHVERLEAKNTRLFHRLLFDGNNPGARFQIKLFGGLDYFVSFPCIPVRPPCYWYDHDLMSNNETIGPLKDD